LDCDLDGAWIINFEVVPDWVINRGKTGIIGTWLRGIVACTCREAVYSPGANREGFFANIIKWLSCHSNEA